jgi:hypothetical protein
VRPNSSKCETLGKPEAEIETNLVLRLEGFRRLNTFKAHSDKRQL